jgi:hypothetical protein
MFIYMMVSFSSNNKVTCKVPTLRTKCCNPAGSLLDTLSLSHIHICLRIVYVLMGVVKLKVRGFEENFMCIVYLSNFLCIIFKWNIWRKFEYLCYVIVILTFNNY